MKKKSLIEMYRIKEGPYDDINKSLSTAKSVAGSPSGQAQKPRVGADGASQKAQTDLDNSKSVFDEAMGGDVDVTLSEEEIEALMDAAQNATGSNPGALGSAVLKLSKATKGGGNSTSSMTSTKTYGSVGMK